MTRWFLSGSRLSQEPEVIYDELCSLLLAKGTPLERVSLVVFLLNPVIHGISFRWRKGEGARSEEHMYGQQAESAYRLSPVAAMREGRVRRIHQSLEGRGPYDYPLLQELEKQGLTDYLLLPLRFSDGAIQCISVATARPGGFDEDDVARIEGMVNFFTLAIELIVQRIVTARLLRTYLGRNAAKQVLRGQVHRGDGESIRAVILMCDLRGFTKLSDEQPRGVLLELLDTYFETVVAAIRKQNGEVLKFIGDAVLAIFRCDSHSSEQKECNRAVLAAREAVHSVADLNRQRREDGQLEILFGIALHIGEVMYGNIGAPDRLDFTVIGPAVNMVSRIEGLCGQLGRSILVSDEFAARIDLEELEDLGTQPLRGISEELRIYAVAPGESPLAVNG